MYVVVCCVAGRVELLVLIEVLICSVKVMVSAAVINWYFEELVSAEVVGW